jgi:hypothetical protein
MAALASVFGIQCGVFSRMQALEHGFDDDAIGRRLRSGEWVREAPGVYRVRWFPDMADHRLWVAYLAVGPSAVVSHECAAARRGFTSVPQDLLVLTSGRSSHHRIPGATVHQLLDVLPHHIELVEGFRITTAARTVVDCAATVSQLRLDRMVEDGLRKKLTTPKEIRDVLGEIARRGKPGMRKLGTSLTKFGPGTVIGDTVLEKLLLVAVLGGGSPMPVPQFPHPGRHPGAGRVDFAYPDVKVILEADGRPWHQRIADVHRDRQRDNEAARAGWVTLRFMYEELDGDPDDVGRAVAETLAERRALFSRH